MDNWNTRDEEEFKSKTPRVPAAGTRVYFN